MEQNSTAVSQSQINDEIDLFELWEGIVSEKRIIAVITFVMICLGGAYLFFAPKSYEVNAVLLPPFEKAVANLSYLDLVSSNSEAMFQLVSKNLTPELLFEQLLKQETIKEIFKESTSAEILQKLSTVISIDFPVEPKEDVLVNNRVLLTSILVTYHDPQEGLSIMNSLLDTVEQQTKAEVRDRMINGLEVKILNNTRQLELEMNRLKQEKRSEIVRLLAEDEKKKQMVLEEMKVLRDKAEKDRLFRIKRLEADYSLAKKLKISKPMDPEDFQKTSVSREVIDVGGATPSNYWLGTIVLQAEIEALKARKTNDPYIASLSELYKKLSDLEVNQTIESLKSRTDIFSFSERLRTLSYQNKSLIQALENINSVDFDVYRLGVHPIEPDDPIKLKKALILAVSGGLGLMLGVFVALIRRAAKNRKELSQMV